MATAYGVGIIGAGMFGAQHARALAMVPGVKLVAASARTPERLQRFTAEFGGAGYTDYRDLIADPAVDVICNVLPHNLHAQVTVEALRAGKAVLLEKPMAPTLADCDAVVRAVAEMGTPFMVAHPYRYMRAYQEALRLIREGAIGRPVAATAAMVKDWTFAQREQWHLAPGGGMWLTNGCHLVDRLCLLLDAQPKDVRAVVGTCFHPQDVDDLGVGLIGFEGGAVGIARAIGYAAGARDDWSEVQGTEGALRVNHTDGLFLARRDAWEPVLQAPSPQLDALAGEWVAFLAHVRGETPSPVSAEYGRLVVATVLAGVASSESGQVTPIA
ncbi:MAG: Gfo/Idh/MocA family oxidoreductase [Chloroflexi bacterium]|nr:Gfo/Idh/MocA family oxidoreductase [Chloroflexota bacterium]